MTDKYKCLDSKHNHYDVSMWCNECFESLHAKYEKFLAFAKEVSDYSVCKYDGCKIPELMKDLLREIGELND